MNEFLHAHASGRDAAGLLRDALAQLGKVPDRANLGFLYCSDGLQGDLPDLLLALRDQTGVQDWVGTVGQGILATGVESYDTPALSILIGSFPADSYRLLAPLTTLEQAHNLGDWAKRSLAHTGVVHVDPNNQIAGDILVSLEERVEGGFFVGGMSSAEHGNQQVFADAVVEGGVSGVVFRGDLPVVAAHTQGCAPIGPLHHITEGRRNILFRLDGRPALDVLTEDISQSQLKETQKLSHAFLAGFPVPGSDTGDYLARNLMGVDKDNRLVAVGEILDAHQQIQFCLRDPDTARADLVRMLEDLKSRIEGRPIRGGLYFSCLGRGRHQFGPNSAEMQIIEDVLGPVPLAGFYANGEIYHSRLYGYTGVMLLFLGENA
jgi:small ligand-binding sensory domain FIST